MQSGWFLIFAFGLVVVVCFGAVVDEALASALVEVELLSLEALSVLGCVPHAAAVSASAATATADRMRTAGSPRVDVRPEGNSGRR